MKELSPGPLLDARGRLAEAGWARSPVKEPNLAGLPRMRLKRWDYYGLWGPDLFASATLADLGYAGLAGVYVMDLATGGTVERTVVRPLARGMSLPDGDGEAKCDGDMSVRFATSGATRRLVVDDPRFDRGQGLWIDVELGERERHESLVIATPMGDRGFYYNRKLNVLPARGQVVRGDRVSEPALGQLDWGRGMWPYRTRWVWASANGFGPGGRALGLNLGWTCGDLSAAGEEALILDGRVHKLGRVRVTFQPGRYRETWRFEDDGSRLALELRPVGERVSRVNLGVVGNEGHQVFGTYHGSVVTDEGEKLVLDGLPGFAEEFRARW